MNLPIVTETDRHSSARPRDFGWWADRFRPWLHSPSPRQLFHAFLGVCLVIATLAFALHSVHLLYEGRYSVTRQDYWRIYALDLKIPFPLNVLYKHNDHPLLFPSLIWLPILYFFHNNQTLLFFCGLAITLATLVLILSTLWRSPSLGLLPHLAMGLIYTVACLWVGKVHILASGGFSCICSLTLGVVLAGLLALDRSGVSKSGVARLRIFAGVVAAGLVATFSFGTGLAVWPTFVLLALLCHRDWKMAIGLGVVGLFSAAIFVLLPTNEGSDLNDGLSRIWSEGPRLIAWVFDVLGAPWTSYGSGWLFPGRTDNHVYLIAGGIGAFGTVLAVYFLIARYRSTRIFEPAETVAFGVVLFVLGSIILVVIGRGSLIAISPQTVLSTRYFFWSTFFWAALPVLSLYRWPHLRRYSVALCLFALIVAAGALPSQRRMGDVYANIRKATEDAALRVVCGVADEASLQELFRGPTSSVGRVCPLANIYREHGLDMFAWPGASMVGKFVTPSNNNQAGGYGIMGHWQVGQAMKTLKKDEPTARFFGWCLTRKTHQPADYVLICLPNGRVVGLGRFTVDQPEQNRKYKLSDNHVLGFQGYIQNYSSKRRYQCHVAVGSKLVPQPLRRIRTDS